MSEKHAMADWPLKRYDFSIPFRYHLSGPSGKGLVICMHGYQDHALSMVRRLGWWGDNSQLPFQVLAINGPFPVPIWTEQGFKEAYSWYFRDTYGNLAFLSPDMTAGRLHFLLRDLGLSDATKVLFGFSQGGYMCPYLASHIENVKGIVGYGCGYDAEIYARCKPMMVQAIHGDKDERIPFEPVREEFSKLVSDRHRGEFHLVPNLTHRVEASAEPLVRRLVLECFES
jgi:predicted esterase